MLKKFGFYNFYSFKEGGEISFIDDEGLSQNVIGIKGGNGSGKTNVLKALSFIKNFAIHSSEVNLDSKIPYRSFFNNNDTTEFYIDFIVEKNEYSYEIEITDNSIKLERLTKNSSQVIYERTANSLTSFSPSIEEFNTIELRNNATLLSLFKKYKFKNEMIDISNVYEFFKNIIVNVNSRGLLSNQVSIPEITEYLNDKPETLEFIKKIVMLADNGISDIQIKERTNDEGDIEYYPVFIHSYEEKKFALTYFDESSGTQSLYKTIALYFAIINQGGVLALDEFDIHLHSLILPLLLELFENKKKNPNSAQFLFTAHNTEIIDYLGEHRTFLVDKDSNESFCYKVSEIPGSMTDIKTNLGLTQLYLDRKLGAVPASAFSSDEDFDFE